MDPKSLTRRADRIIAAIAGRQHGVLAAWQLREVGVSPQQIKVRLRNGRLHELHRGVYLVGHPVPPPYALEMAALLACGPTAILSHQTAASLWRLISSPAPGDICVTVAPGRSAARPNLEIHRARIDRRDVRNRHRMPLTSPPRTILDLACICGDDELERLVAEAHYPPAGVRGRAPRPARPLRRKRGASKLRSIIDLPGGPQRTRSPAERQLVRLLREAGMTGFECNRQLRDDPEGALARVRSALAQ
jgi:hypothetical protein